MTEYAMPAETARALIAELQAYGVNACVGGGWAVDALVGRQTRRHSDLDLWVEAVEFEGLVAAFVDHGVDRLYPWPGDRPWNFVLHDGDSRRVDLHLYETLSDGRFQYGSVNAPFLFAEEDLSGEGEIAGLSVRCERAEFALQNHTGYQQREVDRHDVAVLCEHFGLQLPEGFR
ncbi:nucleotidyltransferase domain-containing protein [Kribbella sp. NPDC048928]|uniref:nucleotidyltransferase domain-containing protein n=1 Tax=Kribbella sp. NPDC048928 TaxID=3364111 RepID=UPI0037223BEA